jgi:hypothetical protein
MADILAAKAIERDEARSKSMNNAMKQDAILRDRLAKKIAQATIVKNGAFWWVPAFFRSRLNAEDKIAKLNRSVLDYAEFCKRQSDDMRVLFQICLDNVPSTNTEFEALRKRLDPAGVFQGRGIVVTREEE